MISDPGELLCSCGHGEYGHHQVEVDDGRVVNYACDFKDDRGCCPCLNFHMVPRPRPAAKNDAVMAYPGSEPKKKVKDQDACVQELGYAWIYMHYLRPGWLEPHNGNDCTKQQKKRVKTLMMECAVEWHRQDPVWWESFYDRIIDEIENMC